MNSDETSLDDPIGDVSGTHSRVGILTAPTSDQTSLTSSSVFVQSDSLVTASARAATYYSTPTTVYAHCGRNGVRPTCSGTRISVSACPRPRLAHVGFARWRVGGAARDSQAGANWRN